MGMRASPNASSAVRRARDSGEATARCDLHVLQALAQGGGLGLAHRGQRDVDLALVTAFGVPRRFAVTCKQDAHGMGDPMEGVGSLAGVRLGDGGGMIPRPAHEPSVGALTGTLVDTGV